MTITLTERAAAYIRKCLDNRGKGLGVRLGVKSSGCSGLAYTLEFADVQHPRDAVFETQGVQVLVGSENLSILHGTELDFAREGLQEGFKFRNPNEKSRCGCGASFHI